MHADFRKLGLLFWKYFRVKWKCLNLKHSFLVRINKQTKNNSLLFLITVVFSCVALEINSKNIIHRSHRDYKSKQQSMIEINHAGNTLRYHKRAVCRFFAPLTVLLDSK